MAITADELKKQLGIAEGELEQAKAYVYRLDGVIQTLMRLIAESEKPEPITTE